MIRRTSSEELALEEKVVSVNRVSKVHKGGRRLSFSSLVVVGDKNGSVGAGLGKANDVTSSIRKAVEHAKKNLIHIPIAGTTIPHPVTASVGATTVLMKPAASGTGVIAGGAVRAVLECAGIKDVLTKCIGSTNAVNTVWATMECLRQLKTPEEIARLRGKPIEAVTAKPIYKAIEYEKELKGRVDSEEKEKGENETPRD